MKEEPEETRLAKRQLGAGNPPPPMVKKYRELNDKLGRLMEQLESGDLTLDRYIVNAGFNLPTLASV